MCGRRVCYGLAAAGQAAGWELSWAIEGEAFTRVAVCINTPADCMAKFVSNKSGAIVFAGIATDSFSCSNLPCSVIAVQVMARGLLQGEASCKNAGRCNRRACCVYSTHLPKPTEQRPLFASVVCR